MTKRPAIRKSAVAAAVSVALMLPGAAVTMAAPPTAAAAACGTPLSADELNAIARLSDTSDIAEDSLARLRTGVARLHEITGILADHRDRRGLFGIGLDAVEQAAVMPLQEDPSAFQDREYAHRISLDLLNRYLDNLHAEFTGGAVAPQWARYFDLAAQCDTSGARATMEGYAAHLVVDLPYTAAAVGTTPGNAPDYFKIVAAIANAGDRIIERTKTVYGADIGPLWRFYGVGASLDLLAGEGVATRPLLVCADLGANVVILGNGLALQNPALHDATAAEIWAMFDTTGTAFAALAQARAL
ncbi:DUF5995 family protein [Nocardia sp. NPDC088792]|uniref:DUF5995 family protein n=1 Tax=Nocardia sp. NPDC088792 TaxID=3364332 RepID=UPI003801A6BE